MAEFTTCPTCKRRSYHPMDIKYAYCPDHGFYGTPEQTREGQAIREGNRA